MWGLDRFEDISDKSLLNWILTSFSAEGKTKADGLFVPLFHDGDSVKNNRVSAGILMKKKKKAFKSQRKSLSRCLKKS